MVLTRAKSEIFKHTMEIGVFFLREQIQLKSDKNVNTGLAKYH